MSLISILKIKGSSLLSAMIFGFVVLVTVSGLVYIVRYNLLSIKGLVAQEEIMTAEQQYIQSVRDKKRIKLGKNKFGDYDFENILQKKQPVFSNKNVDVSLYNAEPSSISSDIVHNLFFKKSLKISKNIIFKTLPNHSMINYDSEFVPINIPYVDISRMNDSESFYHLNKNNKISTKKSGYIGYIEKEYSWLLISVNDRVQVISLDDLNLDNDYEVKIGWNLVKGHWKILVAIYDKENLYIYRANLDDLLKNYDKAILDLSTPVEVIDAPKSIAAVSWYFLKNNTEPSLAVLATRYDDDGNASIIVEDIEYDTLTDNYKTSIKDVINSLGKIDKNNIYIEALDPYYVLGESPLYVFAGDRIFVYKSAKDKSLDKKVLNLNKSVAEELIKNKPVIIKSDNYNYYILVFDNDRYYQYKYTKDTNVIRMSKPVIYPNEKVQNIVVKYGLKFVITKKHIYLDDFDNHQLVEVSI